LPLLKFQPSYFQYLIRTRNEVFTLAQRTFTFTVRESGRLIVLLFEMRSSFYVDEY